MSRLRGRAVVPAAALLLSGSVGGPAALVLAARTAYASNRVTVVAGADSYVDSAAPRSNFGARSWLRVDRSSQQITYLKFKIPSGTNLKRGVKLKIFAETTHSLGIT